MIAKTQTSNIAGKPSSNASTQQDAQLLLQQLAQDLARELNSERWPRRTDLHASLDDDWGFDSLSRAELISRIEGRLGLSLPDRLLREADTLRDILDAVPGAAPLSEPGAEPSTLSPAGVAPVPDSAETLTELLDWHATCHPDRRHIILESDIGTESLTFGALAESARRMAGALAELGVEPGDRIAIMLPTGRDFFFSFFGTLYAGAVPVPVYPPARPSQIGDHVRRQAGILNNARAVVLISDDRTAQIARLLRLHVPSLRHVRTAASLAEGRPGELPKRTGQNMAFLQYTSGSTGDPKGVILTHANLLANIRAMAAVIRPTRDDVFVSWLPLYHDMGLIGAWLGSLHYGVPLVSLPPERFLLRPVRWLEAIHRYRGTLTAAPNFAFELCLKRIDDTMCEQLDLSSLRMAANGAEPVSPSTITRFIHRFEQAGLRPGVISPVYGLAENAVGLAFPPVGRGPAIDRISRRDLAEKGRARPVADENADTLKLVGCGQPLPGHQIRIVGPTGELEERREGRIQFRGPSATSGYLENPSKTAMLFDGDWRETGDLGYFAEGELYVTGRSKDVIIRAGQQIHPQELESAVGEVPGIRQGCIAVFGVTDETQGTERLVVVAETRETDPSARLRLTATVSGTLAALVVTPQVEVVLVPPRTIPKTSSGKIRRSATRELYLRGALEAPKPSMRRQILRLALEGAATSARRLGQLAGEYAYAGYFWILVVLVAAIGWPLVVLLPGRHRKWRVVTSLSQLLLACLGIKPTFRKAEPFPERALIVATHSSYLDALVLSAILPGPLTFVAKHELAAQRVAGPFLQALGTRFVERADPAGGVEGAQVVVDAVQLGERVVIFPEGTFLRAPGLLPFKLGAFTTAVEAQVPVLPLAINGTRSILRGDQWFPRRGRVEVIAGEPIAPDGKDFSAAVRLRDRTRREMLRHSAEPEALQI